MALHTGLRASALGQLCVKDFRLDDRVPCVRVPKALEKNRTENNIPLPPHVVAELKRAFALKAPHAPPPPVRRRRGPGWLAGRTDGRAVWRAGRWASAPTRLDPSRAARTAFAPADSQPPAETGPLKIRSPLPGVWVQVPPGPLDSLRFLRVPTNRPTSPDTQRSEIRAAGPMGPAGRFHVPFKTYTLSAAARVAADQEIKCRAAEQRSYSSTRQFGLELALLVHEIVKG